MRGRVVIWHHTFNTCYVIPSLTHSLKLFEVFTINVGDPFSRRRTLLNYINLRCTTFHLKFQLIETFKNFKTFSVYIYIYLLIFSLQILFPLFLSNRRPLKKGLAIHSLSNKCPFPFPLSVLTKYCTLHCTAGYRHVLPLQHLPPESIRKT